MARLELGIGQQNQTLWKCVQLSEIDQLRLTTNISTRVNVTLQRYCSLVEIGRFHGRPARRKEERKLKYVLLD